MAKDPQFQQMASQMQGMMGAGGAAGGNPLAAMMGAGGAGAGGADPDPLPPLRHLPRPARVRAALASRACRGAVMVGRALDRRAQRRIVSALADLESPWNCPHGRPTMRHLFVLDE